MTTTETPAADKPLKDMTVAELRAYARAQGMSITYLTERRKDELLRIINDNEREAKRAAAAERRRNRPAA